MKKSDMQASDGDEKTESQARDGNSNRGVKRQANDGQERETD